MRRIGAPALAILLAGCVFAPAVSLRTAAVPPQACMEALITGILSRNAQSGLGVTGPEGRSTTVEWPFRYSARDEGGRIALLDETGTVVAHEGDRIQMAGGMGQFDIWYTCGPIEVTLPGR